MTPPLSPGDVLMGKYRVERLLGVGGMGVVLSAMHLDLDRLVAIKVVRCELAKEEAAIQRLMLEARAAARIRSEHVCKVLDVDRLAHGAPFIVMELLDGCDLGALLQKKGRIAVADAVDWVLQACEGLAEAHTLGIVHRDLKPENLFLAQLSDGSTSLKVLDFGISKQMGDTSGRSLTNPTTLMGSPEYMAPEQMLAGDVDHRADIWALGAVTYQLVTGVSAYPGESVAEICAKVLGDPPPPPSQRAPGIPAGLDRVVLRCLRKVPDQRFADVAALARDLAEFGSALAAQSCRRVCVILKAGEARSPPGEAALQTDIAVSTDPIFTAPDDEAVTEGTRHARARKWRAFLIGVALCSLMAVGLRWHMAGRHSNEERTPPSPVAARRATAAPLPLSPPAAPPKLPAVLPEIPRGNMRRYPVALKRKRTVARTAGPSAPEDRASERGSTPVPPPVRPRPIDAWDVESFGARRSP